MSVHAMVYAFNLSIPSTAKFVAVALADNANQDGLAWPSVSTLATKTSLSIRSVQRALDALVSMGILSLVGAGKHGQGMYRFTEVVPETSRVSPGHGTISPTRRVEIIDAFDRKCHWCDRAGNHELDPDGVRWHMDRLVPGSQGGRYTVENVVLACRHCNIGRRGISPPKYPRRYDAPVAPTPPPRRYDASTPVVTTPEPTALEPSLNPHTMSSSTETAEPGPLIPGVALALSGNSNGHHRNGYRAQAVALLDFLNQKAGRQFRAVDATLKPIEGRLRSGATEQDCKGVIARKVRQWGTDPKMRAYLRPETLFAASHFESYLGERGSTL